MAKFMTMVDWKKYGKLNGISADAYEYLFKAHFHHKGAKNFLALVTLTEAIEAIKIDRKSREE